MTGFKPLFTALVMSLCSLTAVSNADSTTCRAEWPLEALPTVFPVDAICGGPVSGAMNLSLMQATDIKKDVVIDAATGASVIRFHNADETGAKSDWPAGETDENASRYIDFALAAPATMEVLVTRISMFIGAYSTGFMKCHINTGFGEGFTDAQTLYEAAQTALPDKEMIPVELTPTLTIPAGETLHVRVLPWLEQESGSGKYILLHNMNIEGQVFETGGNEGLEEIPSSSHKGGDKGRFILRNGHLFILRDGKTYTVSGQEINKN